MIELWIETIYAAKKNKATIIQSGHTRFTSLEFHGSSFKERLTFNWHSITSNLRFESFNWKWFRRRLSSRDSTLICQLHSLDDISIINNRMEWMSKVHTIHKLIVQKYRSPHKWQMIYGWKPTKKIKSILIMKPQNDPMGTWSGTQFFNGNDFLSIIKGLKHKACHSSTSHFFYYYYSVFDNEIRTFLNCNSSFTISVEMVLWFFVCFTFR